MYAVPYYRSLPHTKNKQTNKNNRNTGILNISAIYITYFWLLHDNATAYKTRLVIDSI